MRSVQSFSLEMVKDDVLTWFVRIETKRYGYPEDPLKVYKSVVWYQKIRGVDSRVMSATDEELESLFQSYRNEDSTVVQAS